ncbi:uncharacterized protein BX663DRAFT_548902 [Cokeromyces recurvatus]|uniref:uncharacterized protein n=1 Tax=Cokeromyces recurvatus TaxID=90255 RepID=UPI00221F9FA3|nr:uncharacterized protein BX663DRAFT_548902 [Cokeromyces recurvatus]KAI7906756.1 hypothetical protein BX663DRAFT_548902 [Cokeromyces recurvatus]
MKHDIISQFMTDSNKYIYKEDHNDNDNILSDLTIDHHPSRGCEYFFDQERALGEANDHGEIAQDEWVIGDLCVSEKCRLLKDNILKLKKSPGSLLDIRLLVMNDIFIFEADVNMSASKYFRLEDHNAIISSLNAKQYCQEMGVKAQQC